MSSAKRDVGSRLTAGRKRAAQCGCAVVALLALVPHPTEGQRRSAALVGTVVDSAGAPVAGADVAIVALRALAQTDSGGHFHLRRLDPGMVTVTIRRLGFDPKALDAELRGSATDTVHVQLVSNVHLLEGIQVEADMRRRSLVEDFHRRRVRGMGFYVTREEIEQRHAYRTSDALRAAPGIRFVRVHGGMGIRFNASAMQRRDCIPMIWLDGQRIPGMEVDEVPVGDVEGIELYSGPSTTPLQFSQSVSMATCGTVVIWTRVPGT